MTRPSLRPTWPPRAARGFSLLELMTSITIGLLIMAGLASVFVNSSTANKEMKNNAEQIENGRYAIEFLTQDVRHAGYYGELAALPVVPAAAPDPCAVPTAGAVSDTSNNALALPVQYISAGSIPAGCAALTPANLMAGSDIVVVRRADTTQVNPTGPGATTVGLVYIQSTTSGAELQYGAGGAINNTQNAAAAASTLQRRDFSVAAAGTPPQFPQIAAAIRRYRMHIYFVAPCSTPNGGGVLCTGPADDLGKPVPTLKRLELGAAGAFTIVPIVEGIDAIRVEYGVDDSPINATDPGTGSLVGDGLPDVFVNAPTVAQMGNTVAARIYVLARNTTASLGYVDDKTYTLGTFVTAATGDAFKRHVYGAETRVANQSGRREIPR